MKFKTETETGCDNQPPDAAPKKQGYKPSIKLIDRWKVLGMLGISDSTLDRIVTKEVNFPVSFRIGHRSIRWLEHEVEDYIYKLERSDRFE